MDCSKNAAQVVNMGCVGSTQTRIVGSKARMTKKLGGFDAVRNLSALCGVVWLVGCTALDSTSVGDTKISSIKPRVGRYYLLPKALLTLEGAPDEKGNLLINATVSLVADSRFRYFLIWRPNVFSDDIFNNIDVDSDGMLTSINYSAEDKTPQILSDLVTTTVNIAKIAKDLGGLALEVKKYPPFTYTFDPFDSAETARAERELRDRQNLELRISPGSLGVRSAIGKSINRRTAYVNRADDPPGGGVFYHPPTTIELLMIDHNVDAVAGKDAVVKKAQQDAVAAAFQRLQDDAAAKAQADADKAKADAEKAKAEGKPTPDASASPAGSPANPVKKAKAADMSPAVDKTQPTPKPATLCHVVITVPDVDQVACLPLGRSFLTKRESNVGFAHGMPTTMSFKQPSAVQAFTGTLSSITGIVASAVPSLVNVKSTTTAAPNAAPVPDAGLEAKTVGNGTGGKKIGSKTMGPAALSVQDTPGASDQDWQSTVDLLNKNRSEDTQTIGMLRALLITQLRAEGKSMDEVNTILVGKGLVRVQPNEWR
jgi:hypothetical protein